MIIVCPNCNKKFDIDQNLIPSKGRLLQCGSCNHSWFYKLKLEEEKIVEDPIIKDKSKFSNQESLKKKINNKNKKINVTLSKNNNEVPKNIYKTNSNEKNNFYYLNILLVLIISAGAIIIILDTFKEHLSHIFPNINILLDNLYQSFEDIKLFVKDLLK